MGSLPQQTILESGVTLPFNLSGHPIALGIVVMFVRRRDPVTDVIHWGNGQIFRTHVGSICPCADDCPIVREDRSARQTSGGDRLEPNTCGKSNLCTAVGLQPCRRLMLTMIAACCAVVREGVRALSVAREGLHLRDNRAANHRASLLALMFFSI